MQKAKYIVMTTVKVQPANIDSVVKLFADTNPSLVKSQTDWIEATLSVNREASEITVMAFWKNQQSYLKLSSSQLFQDTMKQFAAYFVSPPTVHINEILFEMNQASL